MKAFFGVALLMLSGAVFAQESIPNGAILSVRLDSTLSLKSKPGEKIEARLMQDVLLPGGGHLKGGSQVLGHVIAVKPASAGSEASVAFTFDKLIVQGHALPIMTDLRAMASPMEVDNAQVPAMGPDRGTPPSAYTTVQIGGDDVVYRGGGHVMDASEIVGEPTSNGILGNVRPNPEGDCRGVVASYDQPAAFWVFSTDACGLYGFAGVHVVRTGRIAPAGQIELSSKGRLKIWGGSGLLLRVTSPNVSAG